MQLIKKLSEPRVLFFLGLVYTVLITIALFLPPSDVFSIVDFPSDKIVHVFIHLLLMFIWSMYAVARRDLQLVKKDLTLLFFLCLAYGIVIEIVQGYTATRISDIYDILANIVGTILGIVLFRVVFVRIRRKI